MPRVSDAHVAWGPRALGLYERLVERRCRDACLVGDADPRRRLYEDPAVVAAAEAKAQQRAAAQVKRWLDAERPVEAAFWEVAGGRHGVPHVLTPEGWHRGQEFTVHRDDTIHLGWA